MSVSVSVLLSVSVSVSVSASVSVSVSASVSVYYLDISNVCMRSTQCTPSIAFFYCESSFL